MQGGRAFDLLRTEHRRLCSRCSSCSATGWRSCFFWVHCLHLEIYFSWTSFLATVRCLTRRTTRIGLLAGIAVACSYRWPLTHQLKSYFSASWVGDNLAWRRETGTDYYPSRCGAAVVFDSIGSANSLFKSEQATTITVGLRLRSCC